LSIGFIRRPLRIPAFAGTCSSVRCTSRRALTGYLGPLYDETGASQQPDLIKLVAQFSTALLR
jgi:hypothetical protein